MTELRLQIDQLDIELMQLLGKRTTYIDRAAELKPAEGLPARIDQRVEAVVQNARANAETVKFDADLAEKLWRILIEWSIHREEKVLGPSEQRKSA